jgi:hypothetical protein
MFFFKGQKYSRWLALAAHQDRAQGDGTYVPWRNEYRLLRWYFWRTLEGCSSDFGIIFGWFWLQYLFKGLTVPFLSHMLPAGRGSTSCWCTLVTQGFSGLTAKKNTLGNLGTQRILNLNNGQSVKGSGHHGQTITDQNGHHVDDSTHPVSTRVYPIPLPDPWRWKHLCGTMAPGTIFRSIAAFSMKNIMVSRVVAVYWLWDKWSGLREVKWWS